MVEYLTSYLYVGVFLCPSKMCAARLLQVHQPIASVLDQALPCHKEHEATRAAQVTFLFRSNLTTPRRCLTRSHHPLSRNLSAATAWRATKKSLRSLAQCLSSPALRSKSRGHPAIQIAGQTHAERAASIHQ